MVAESVNELPGAPEKSIYFQTLRRRILHAHNDGGWEGLVRRVQSLASEAEARWGESDQGSFVWALGEALRKGEFLPNSPLLVNSASENRRLFACFAVDSRRPLSEFLPVVRRIHDGMGGVGYTLDDATGQASFESFVREVDDDTSRHQMGRPRPGSTAVTASIDHPGSNAILRLSGTMLTTGLNIGIPDDFFSRIDAGDVAAVDRLGELAAKMHETGQPGVVFTDRIPRISRDRGAPFAANVCGESPLAADESALLGSINLVQFLTPAPGGVTLDWLRLDRVVRLAVRFLDGMHDIHEHPSVVIGANSLATRKIGIGVMGFAHFLALLGMRYGDDSSVAMAERIASALTLAATEESERLAESRGSFPAWHPGLEIIARRNALLVAISGTSTLALLVGTTGGIEPVFSYVTRHRVMQDMHVVLDPIVELFGRERGVSSERLLRRLSAGEPLSRVLGDDVAHVLPLAHDIPAEQQIQVQAAFQKYIDGGITKTLNCPSYTPVEDIADWIRLAHKRGCMGLTVYRDGSRAGQPVVRAS
jgi:ribonucleoside-diphosphate reductase alpha chain